MIPIVRISNSFAHNWISRGGTKGSTSRRSRRCSGRVLLDKLDALCEAPTEATQPATLPKKMIQYKQLTKPLLINMITAWEPTLARPGHPGRPPLWHIPRDTLLNWALYALNVKPVHKLPHVEELRRVQNFLLYTTARYKQLFSRLQCLRADTERTKDSVPGYLSTLMETKKITLNIAFYENKPFEFVYNFGTHDDWTIAKPFSVDAALHSKQAGEMMHLCTKLKASLNITLPDPTDNSDVMPAYGFVSFGPGLGPGFGFGPGSALASVSTFDAASA